MNTRVLELIKNPKSITETDLKILESESEKMPYAQSIRALYLYGINLYNPENYKENLSKTAAYTTDKKILYQFINSEKISKKDEITPASKTAGLVSENQETKDKIIEDKKSVEPELSDEIENPEKTALNKFDVEKIIESESKENPEFVVVDGEKNRILYEGEENFLEEKTPEVDLDATKESGQLVLKEETETIDSLIVIDENRAEESIIEENSEIPDEIITEEIKPEQTYQEIENQTETSSVDISFGGSQDFLPEVKFSVPKNHLDYLNPPQKEIKEEKSVGINVAKKGIFVEKTPEKELQIDDQNGISFENTQAFEITETHKVEILEPAIHTETEYKTNFENTQKFEVIESNSIEAQTPVQTEEVKPEVVKEEPASEWKPMSFSANTPDALIGKQTPDPIQKVISEEVSVSKPAVKSPVIEEKTAEEIKISESEMPVFNVSFFGNEVSKIEEKKEEVPAVQEKIVNETVDNASNVGTFINTWQNWLKIDRAESKVQPSKKKEKIIDNFIENNPKISQLKEESTYVVKEKKDDISHLMTETLAKLYAEQKLYSKAIKAYEILSEKHPHKKDYFEEKIEEIKEMRKPQ
ncbi:MAG: hypothetical protein DI529_01330 [Chryseobacterium sp.]|nr:MAG: hypothetical protein DI529_01330 [Chryseobacterium sp.]